MSYCIDFVSEDFPKLDLIEPNEEHIYFVPKHVYDEDLMSCMPGGKCRQQFLNDIRRCNFIVDGELTRTLTNIHIALLPYCTQTVMGIPMTILSNSDDCVISECIPGQRMRVELWNDQIVYIDKVLDVHTEKRKRIRTTIKVDLSDANVEIRFLLLDLKDSELKAFLCS